VPLSAGGSTTMWHLDPSSRLATMNMNWGCDCFWGRGAESASNTMSSGPRPTSVPSGMLIHPSRLATIDIGQKLGGCCAFMGEES